MQKTKKKEHIVEANKLMEKYLEYSAAYTFHTQRSHEIWLEMGFIRDKMTALTRKKTIKALAGKVIKRMDEK